ncbi:GFA family protein [Luteibacter yeojuensis]|uniref:CENP-V/GFA domain-containing protein n=1 Tax=Luteibacter yeojuensis TaxID=345309 RepID=A0A0F3KUB0_9GAMM|nr:GFA family protein [Luteibacter yeojuensis]KJV34746.1 hypothetical protein VI08_09115 [Luteibacter yeojuensis]
MATGACRCGQVSFTTASEPVRCGICHCMDCRARSGAPFIVFVIFPLAAVTIRGARRPVPSASGVREACATCGSMVCWIDDQTGEIELYAGLFSAPGLFKPEYEVWTLRREPWLPALQLAQYPRDRPKR